jgi:hypothetical protein
MEELGVRRCGLGAGRRALLLLVQESGRGRWLLLREEEVGRRGI